MPLLEHCWCCTLRVAASVISIYLAVAYMIAFLMEMWWLWSTGGQLPHLGYVLIMAYLLTFILSAILVKGVSEKQIPNLLVWLFGVLVFLLPEGGLVLFMSFQFWKIYTIYGLTEITFWICRLIVNISGLICVHSLYSYWKEEKQVLSSLRDLNMASRAVHTGRRRPSVISTKGAPPVGYVNPAIISETDHPVIIPRTNLRRSPSLRSLPPPPRTPSPSPSVNEFNAALYNSRLKSLSVMDLRGGPPPTFTPVPTFNLPPHHPNNTQSLDRKLLYRSKSIGFFPTEDRMRNGYFGPLPVSGFVIDPTGRVAYIQDPRLEEKPWPADSKISIESDDMQKYRDVAL
ncbi:uncharacterized protein Rcd6 [Halyomorpha halys]|uniref:uncharacterized protein Rcd6 n=1 Tax=Halyomorpha halys TaxID=286706 RepID=UPI0006D4CE49